MYAYGHYPPNRPDFCSDANSPNADDRVLSARPLAQHAALNFDGSKGARQIS
jgi:hypothetical protein